MDNAHNQIALGRIMAVYGLQGWVKIYSECRPRDGIFTYKHFYAQLPSGKQFPLTLQDGKKHGRGLIARFSEITQRDAALTFIGAILYLSRTDLPTLPDGEFYWTDLIGMRVINLHEQILGTVTTLLETGANDVLVVSDSEQEYFIPFVKQHYVIKIDAAQRLLQVDWETSWL